MNDNAFYEEVAAELQEDRMVPGTWVHAYAEADGDEHRAKAIYIKMRIADLEEAQQQAQQPAQIEETPGGNSDESPAVVRSRKLLIWILVGVIVVTVILGAVALYRPAVAQQNAGVAAGPVVVQKKSMPAGGDASAVSWEAVSERWVRNTYADGSVTMSDIETGKMWTFNANPYGKAAWTDATAICDNLTYAGYSDWRLPGKDEIAGQFIYKGYFADVQDDYYWSSSPYEDFADHACFVNMRSGNVSSYYRTYTYCVWPVRGRQ